MAEKRAATTDVHKLLFDKIEEPEKNGTFETASVDELKNRVIKKARRKIAPSTESNENQNIFTGFSGFKNTSPQNATTSPFSFLNKLSPKNSSEHINKEKSENTNAVAKDINNAHVKDYSKLKGLNQAVLEWIKKHVNEDPICILTPIFKDYENYLNEVLADKNDVKSSNENLTKSDDQLKMFTFVNTDNQIKTNPTENSSPLKTQFLFGSNNTAISTNETLTTSAPSIFANTKSIASPSIFGNSKGFQFGTSEMVNTTNIGLSTTGFSFTNSKPFSFAGNVSNQNSVSEKNQNDAVEEEIEEPPKNEFKAVIEEDSVYSKRCKVFVKHDGNYADRGVGTLYLKPIKDTDKTQLLVRADTNLGNILLNFILSEGLPSQRMGKNNVMIVCIPTPESEPKPTSILLRVKTDKEADELLDKINNYKK